MRKRMTPACATLAAALGVAAVAYAGAPLTLPTDATQPEVRALAAPSAIGLGGRFTVFVTAAFDDGVEVNLREPLALGEAFEVKRRVSADTRRADGRREREWQLDVVAWDVGDLEIPPIAVTFTVNGGAGQVETHAVPIHVSGVRAKGDDKLRGDAPPIAIATRTWWPLELAACGLAVLAIAALAWRRRSGRWRGPIANMLHPQTKLDGASVRALGRLQVLDQAGTLERDVDRKGGYIEMVDIIREYVGLRYGVATLDLTVGELSRALVTIAPDDDRAMVDGWLSRCELVKYGGQKARVDDARAQLAAARELVIATSRSQVPEPARVAA